MNSVGQRLLSQLYFAARLHPGSHHPSSLRTIASPQFPYALQSRFRTASSPPCIAGYRAEHYARRVATLLDRLPNATIGDDVITGFFPRRNRAYHSTTLDFIAACPFTYLHVFPTHARHQRHASLPGQLSGPVIKTRAREKNPFFRSLADSKFPRLSRLRKSADPSASSHCGANAWPTIPIRLHPLPNIICRYSCPISSTKSIRVCAPSRLEDEHRLAAPVECASPCRQ